MTEAEPPPPRIDHVAVIGAGFAGTLQAINLLRHDGPRVTLIERRGTFGRGTAYSTPNPDHLLNVRAANMSALPDDPGHFACWLDARGKGVAHDFARRQDYGLYLGELLAEAAAAAPGRLELRHDSAADLACDVSGVTIGLDGGRPLRADAAILALGNLPPHDPPHVAGQALGDAYTSDPWGTDLAADLRDDDAVMLLGTGLTMVDVALTLDRAGFRGPIVALSRRGLVPRAHEDVTLPADRRQVRPVGPLAHMLREFRVRAARIGWRAAVDELRPFTRDVWLGAGFAEQARFLRHLRAWWDVHRHRLAPPVAERIAALRASGRLRVAAGRLTRAAPAGRGIDVAWTMRGGAGGEALRARRLINCTGPQGDLLRTREPLLHLLLASGQIRPDAHRIGIDVDAQGRTIDVQGRASRRLLALGPMTRGTFWEIVAVPDIRVQTWAVARRLANAHWVGGEGL